MNRAVSPSDFGLIGDGESHPLSGKFATLAAAQAVYPFATDLTQEIDYCAFKSASNAAFGPDGSENGSFAQKNLVLELPGCVAFFGNDTWTIRNLASGRIQGAGKIASVLTGNKTIFATDGLWYSELADFSVQCQTNGASVAFDIDGNVPGHPYDTRGVQGNTFRNLLIDGGSSALAASMCRLGGSGAQGSENLFLSVHFQNAFDCYYQNGFNALDNLFVGGNCQNYQRNGLWAVGAPIGVLNMGFQSTVGYHQFKNDGWDIRVGDSGAYTSGFAYGCRTESMRFLHNNGAINMDVRACGQNLAFNTWSPNTVFNSAMQYGEAVWASTGNIFVATTPGTSGPTAPAWSTDGVSTVTDGTIVWTPLTWEYIFNVQGAVDRLTLSNAGGPIVGATSPFLAKIVTSDYVVQNESVLFVNCTAGPIRIGVPGVYGSPGNSGNRQLIVKKVDTSSNAVTIRGNMEDGSSTDIIPGGARGYRTYMFGSGARYDGGDAWMVVASS